MECDFNPVPLSESAKTTLRGIGAAPSAGFVKVSSRRILLKKSKNRGRRKLAKLQSDGTLPLDAISVLLRTSHAA
jgi:hypothetical protein